MTKAERRSLRSEDATAQIHELTPAETPLTEDRAVIGRISVRREWAKQVRKGAKQKLLGDGADSVQNERGYAEHLLYGAAARRA